MLITKEDLSDLWKFLTVDSLSGTWATLIFVANNCDSLCACKILTDLLKQSNIQYTVVPVFSYPDIESKLTDDALSSDIKSLVFLNCGAKLDFTEYSFMKNESPLKVFIFESQRPISHNNVLTQLPIYVVDFGSIDVGECPEDDDFKALEQEDEEEDDVVDGEKEYQLIINGGKQKSEESKSQDAEDEDEDFDINLDGKKRKHDEGDHFQDRDIRKKKAERIEEYYNGSSFSKWWAYLVYCLAVQLNQQSIDSFWLWILGLTDQLIHSKITQLQYEEELSECQKEFLSISDQNFNQENDSFRNNPFPNDGESNNAFDKNGLLYANVNLDTENIKVGSILPQQEFRFMFLRFWTLYQSMYHSNYMVSKLKLWQELGRKELTKLLAMLGIPPSEYDQQYRFMSHKYKESLKTKIMEIAPKFDLENILYPSFIRQIDNKTQLNAADMVYAVTSLLESPQAVMIEEIPDHEKVDDPEKENWKEPEVIDLQHTREMQVENFWAAYKALNTKNRSYLESGIFLAKKLQKSLMYQCNSLITSKAILPCTTFRYAIIENDKISEAKIFQYPLAIQKLALFVQEVYEVTRVDQPG